MSANFVPLGSAARGNGGGRGGPVTYSRGGYGPNRGNNPRGGYGPNRGNIDRGGPNRGNNDRGGPNHGNNDRGGYGPNHGNNPRGGYGPNRGNNNGGPVRNYTRGGNANRAAFAGQNFPNFAQNAPIQNGQGHGDFRGRGRGNGRQTRGGGGHLDDGSYQLQLGPIDDQLFAGYADLKDRLSMHIIADSTKSPADWKPTCLSDANLFVEDEKCEELYKNVVDDAEITTKATEKLVLESWDEKHYLKYTDTETLRTNIRSRNFESPRKFQQLSIPYICNGNHLFATGPSGCGKTLAFILPILKFWYKDSLSIDEKVKFHKNLAAPYAIVICPTRDLVEQVYNEFRKCSQGTPIIIRRNYGQIDKNEAKEWLKGAHDILVTTPGRLRDKYFQLDLSELRFLVFDSADFLISGQDKNDFDAVLDLYQDNLKANKRKQLLSFSTTKNENFEQNFEDFCKSFGEGPNGAVELSKVEYFYHVNENVEQVFEELEYAERFRRITEMLSSQKVLLEGKKCFIFTNTKEETEKFAFAWIFLDDPYFSKHVYPFSSLKCQQTRHELITKFRQDGMFIAVCSDVLAPGIDIKDADLVINFSLPDHVNKFEMYVNRVGRTGRLALGKAISFVDPKKDRELLKAIYDSECRRSSKKDIPPSLTDIMHKLISSNDNGPVPNDAHIDGAAAMATTQNTEPTDWQDDGYNFGANIGHQADQANESGAKQEDEPMDWQEDGFNFGGNIGQAEKANEIGVKQEGDKPNDAGISQEPVNLDDDGWEIKTKWDKGEVEGESKEQQAEQLEVVIVDDDDGWETNAKYEEREVETGLGSRDNNVSPDRPMFPENATLSESPNLSHDPIQAFLNMIDPISSILNDTPNGASYENLQNDVLETQQSGEVPHQSVETDKKESDDYEGFIDLFEPYHLPIEENQIGNLVEEEEGDQMENHVEEEGDQIENPVDEEETSPFLKAKIFSSLG